MHFTYPKVGFVPNQAPQLPAVNSIGFTVVRVKPSGDSNILAFLCFPKAFMSFRRVGAVFTVVRVRPSAESLRLPGASFIVVSVRQWEERAVFNVFPFVLCRFALFVDVSDHFDFL